MSYGSDYLGMKDGSYRGRGEDPFVEDEDTSENIPEVAENNRSIYWSATDTQRMLLIYDKYRLEGVASTLRELRNQFPKRSPDSVRNSK